MVSEQFSAVALLFGLFLVGRDDSAVFVGEVNLARFHEL